MELDDDNRGRRRWVKVPFEDLMRDLPSSDFKTRIRAASLLCRDYRDRLEPIPALVAMMEDESESDAVRRALSISIEEYDDVRLFIAIMKFYRQLLRIKGTSASAGDNDLIPPEALHSRLRDAVLRSQLRVAEFLIAKGAKVEDESNLSSPFFIAASSGQVEMSRLLLKHGADVQFSRRFGLTPLHMAVATGKVELVKMILDAGANPRAESKEGSPLAISERKGHTKVSELLRNAMANDDSV